MRFNASMFSLSHFFPRPTSPPLDNCIRELSPFAAGNEDTRCIMHLSLLPSRRYITPPEINASDVSRMETKLSRTCFLLFFLFVSSKLKLFPLLFAAPNMFSFLNYDHELNHWQITIGRYLGNLGNVLFWRKRDYFCVMPINNWQWSLDVENHETLFEGLLYLVFEKYGIMAAVKH